MTIHPAFANLSPERRGKGIYWQRSWNVVRGCSKVSPGCDHCWLEAETARHAKHPDAKISLPCWPAITNGAWSGLVCMDSLAVTKPLTIQKPTVWALWSDLFHEQVTDDFLDRVFAVMALAPWHLFLVLTKRPERMKAYFERCRADNWNNVRDAINHPSLCGQGDRKGSLETPLPNVWLGVTAENQAMADARIPILLETPAAARFVSLEPMLGPINLGPYFTICPHCGWWEIYKPRWGEAYCQDCGKEFDAPAKGLSWVIAGGETGPGARPMHPDWLRSLRDKCAAAGVPFLLKQWGNFQNGSAPKVPPVCVYHDGRSVPATPKAIKAEERRSGISHDRVGNNPVIMSLVGKRAAGRLLDGITHDAYPQEAA